MPQAMPMYWMNLYLMLIFIFLMITIKLYFNYLKLPYYKKMKFFKNLIWKW
uniref:ATP synthase F0 subunit 8 n=1 Tax=Halyzia sedecimguttata TaxID=347359 RepID=A0A0S2M7H6_9CUCU|nr:ATP synthase F0 subunit 8 [Halyzia sedecimguttata]